MKKILFWSGQAFLLILFALWLVYCLNYYHGINLDGLPLPRINWELYLDPNVDVISKIPGFVSFKDIGFTLVNIGSGGLIVYFGSMLAMYFSENVSKTLVFWLNIAFYSMFLIFVIIGILFINIQL